MRQPLESMDTTIGQNIRKLRILCGMSQSVLGSKLKEPITFQMIQKYESAQSKITVSVLIEIANILEKDITDFFDEDRKGGTTRQSLVDMRTLHSLERLPKERKSLVGSLIKMLGEYNAN